MTQSLGLIGVGAFGALAAQHLAPHFDVVLYDTRTDVSAVIAHTGARSGDLATAAQCDIVVLAVPVQNLRQTLTDIASLLKKDALILDVASVKIKPVAWMLELLPSEVALVGTHPMFGPQSGKNGITGLNIVLCDIRGNRGAEVAAFCADKLGLKPHLVTPEAHDREAAMMHGLTHLLTKIVVDLDLPAMRFPTRTYELMQQMVEMIRYDSDALFRTITQENPFAAETQKAFFAATRAVEARLTQKPQKN